MRTRNFTRTATAAVLAGLLIFPTGALAASRIGIGNNYYDAGTEASGEGWSWNGADDMTLDGYNNGWIYHRGDLTITLSGENTVEYIRGSYTSQDAHDGVLTITGDGSLLINGEQQYGDEGGIINECATVGDEAPEYGVIIDNTNVTIEDGVIYSRSGIQINRSTVNVENRADSPQPAISGTQISIDTSYVHAVDNYQIDEPNPDAADDIYDSENYATRAAVEASVRPMAGDTGATGFVLSGVEGDTDITEYTVFGYTYNALSGPEDGDVNDILLTPIPEDVSEEKAVTRTITYVFEDGSEAAATKTDTQTLTRAGKKNPLTEETTWDEWTTGSFDDVESPVIEGYTAKLVLVAGEDVDADSEDLTYEVVYVKDEEPAPEPEPEPTPETEPEPVPEPAPTPEPAKAVIPQTGDVASTAQGLAAGIGALLSAVGITLKRRKD